MTPNTRHTAYEAMTIQHGEARSGTVSKPRFSVGVPTVHFYQPIAAKESTRQCCVETLKTARGTPSRKVVFFSVCKLTAVLQKSHTATLLRR